MIAFTLFFGISSVALALAVTALLSQRTALQEKLQHCHRVIGGLYPLAYKYVADRPADEADDWVLECGREIVEESMEEDLIQE